MTKYFIVASRSYEYDDEHYVASENGVEPMHLYKTKQRAEQQIVTLTMDWLRNNNPLEYGEDGGFFNYRGGLERFTQLVAKFFPPEKAPTDLNEYDSSFWASYYNKNPGIHTVLGKMTPEDRQEMFACFRNSLYVIKEIELED